jgi:tetratricopeptide (TPR) repeat protein
MGLFDRFKSKTATTQEGPTARKRSYEWYEKGLALYMTGHNEDAIPYFDKSLEIEPNYEDAWTRKAYALFKLDRFQEALPCFDKSLELTKKSDYYTWEFKGHTLAGLGRDQEAISCFDKSLELNPSDVMAEINKQQVLERNRKTAKK